MYIDIVDCGRLMTKKATIRILSDLAIEVIIVKIIVVESSVVGVIDID